MISPILGKIADRFAASFSFLNRKNSPSNKVAVTDLSNSPIIQTGKVEGDVHQTTVYRGASRTRPSLDIRTDGHSGGSDGVTISFVIRNDGSESARNITVQFLDGKNIIKEEKLLSLTTNESTRLTHSYTNTAYFLTRCSEPKLVLHYSAIDGRRFKSGTRLIQEERADGSYNLSVKLGESFDQSVGHN